MIVLAPKTNAGAAARATSADSIYEAINNVVLDTLRLLSTRTGKIDNHK